MYPVISGRIVEKLLRGPSEVGKQPLSTPPLPYPSLYFPLFLSFLPYPLLSLPLHFSQLGGLGERCDIFFAVFLAVA